MTHELHICRKARAFVESLPNADREEWERVVRNLCYDPSIDQKTKFTFPMPPIVLNLYQDTLFRFTYRIVDNYVVDILNAGYAPELP